MDDKRRYASEVYFSPEMLHQRDYVRAMIREQKIKAIDKLLDETHHGQHWVFRFDEEWQDVPDYGGYPGTPYYWANGGKVCRLRLDISKAYYQKWVIPEQINTLDVYQPAQFEHKKKGWFIRLAEKVEAHFEHDLQVKRFNKWFSGAG